MRKLLSLVLAFAMILGLFAFPVSADESMYQAVGQELMNYGVLKGVDAQGTLKEMDKLTREESLVVLSRLMGQEDKAMATEAVADFTDVPATHWAAKYVAYAKLQGWTTGVSEKEFGLGQQVTTQQVVTFMMRALGYKEVKWEEAMTKAKELGLLEGVSAMAEDQIIRGEVFIVMKNTLYTKPMNEKQELIYKLGLKENPVPETLEVVDVKADNLKEVVVEFNQEVDKDTLKDAFRFVGASQGTLTSELKEDGKTVVVTVGTALKNLKMYKFQVSGVKTLAGVKMEKVVKEFKAADVEAPVVEGIKVTGPRSFQVMFSEPISNRVHKGMKLFVNGKASFGLTPNAKNADLRVVNVETSTLKDGTTYTVRVEGFQDYAGYTNKIDEKEFDYAKVATAPALEVVKATQEYVEVKFDRPVKGLKLDNFYHTFSSYKPQEAYKNMEEMNKTTPVALNPGELKDEYRDSVIVSFVPDVKKFVEKKAGTESWKPLPAGDVKFVVTGKNIVDAWNNKFEEFEQVLNITADKEAPVVESVEVTGENEIVVTFSKKVVLDKANYEILKEDGSKFDGLKLEEPKEEGNTGVKLTVKSPKMVGKTVVLNIKDVKDKTINMNKLASAESQTITFGDKTFVAPKEGLFTKDTQVAKIRIKFDEAVNADTATNKKNYKFQVGTEAKTPDFEVSMFSDKIVELVFTKEEWTKKVDSTYALPGGFKVVLSNQITDVAGNQFPGFQAIVNIVDTTAGEKPTIKSVIATTTDRVKITFSEEVKKIVGENQEAFIKEDFIVSGAVVDNLLSEEVNEDGQTVIELELKSDSLLQPNTAGNKLTLKDAVVVTNMLDTPMAKESETTGTRVKDITDKIKPEHVKLPAEDKGLYKGAYGDVSSGETYESLGFVFKVDENTTAADEPAVAARWNATENRYEIVVVYNEAMEIATMSTTTFKVKGWSVSKPEYLTATATGAVKNVILIPLSAPNNEYKAEMFDDVTVEQVGVITDMKANTLDSLKEIKIQDTLKTKGFSLKHAVTSAKNKLVAKYTAFDTEMNNEYTNTPQHGKMYFVPADHATEVTAYTNAKNKVDALTENSTVKDVEDAGKALVKAIADIKALAEKVAPELTGQTVKASVKKVGFVNLSEAADTTHYALLKNENKYLIEGNSATGLLPKEEEVDAQDSTLTHILLVKVEGDKIVSYKVEALAGKKGEMTAEVTSIVTSQGTAGTANMTQAVADLTQTAVTLDLDNNQSSNIKITFTQGIEAQKATYTLENLESGSAITNTGSPVELTSGNESADIAVTKAGKFKVVITVTDTAKLKVPRVYESTVTVTE